MAKYFKALSVLIVLAMGTVSAGHTAELTAEDSTDPEVPTGPPVAYEALPPEPVDPIDVEGPAPRRPIPVSKSMLATFLSTSLPRLAYLGASTCLTTFDSPEKFIFFGGSVVIFVFEISIAGHYIWSTNNPPEHRLEDWLIQQKKKYLSWSIFADTAQGAFALGSGCIALPSSGTKIPAAAIVSLCYSGVSTVTALFKGAWRKLLG